jgi:hypothetical protein
MYVLSERKRNLRISGGTFEKGELSEWFWSCVKCSRCLVIDDSLKGLLCLKDLKGDLEVELMFSRG